MRASQRIATSIFRKLTPLEKTLVSSASRSSELVVSFRLQSRWKHQAKTGQHLQNLEEMSNMPRHNEAQEKRREKKAKKSARKAKKTSPKEDSSGGLANEDLSLDEDYQVEDDEPVDDVDEEGDVLPNLDTVKTRMKKIVNRYEESLKTIRGGQPTVELFDGVTVSAYGDSVPLSSVAQVVLVSPIRATASAFDPSVNKAIQKALHEQLQLNSSLDEGGSGDLIIPLPRVSMESRKQLASSVQKRVEKVKKHIREVRRKALTPVKQGVAGRLEGVSKDDAFRLQNDIEATTDDAIKLLSDACERKVNDILDVK